MTYANFYRVLTVAATAAALVAVFAVQIIAVTGVAA